jgi:iron(III) transport system ATP-binding protein
LLDEPFSNLDVALRARVRADLHRLLADADVTTVFVTHDQEEAFVLGDQVAVMRDGEILQSSSPFDLYTSPGDPWIAAFVGDVNLVPGTAEGSEVGTAIGRLPTRSAGHGPVQVLVRPEDLSVAPGDDCIVTLVEFYGGAVLRLRVRAGHVRKGDRIGVQHSGAPVVTFPAISPAAEPGQGAGAPVDGAARIHGWPVSR